MLLSGLDPEYERGVTVCRKCKVQKDGLWDVKFCYKNHCFAENRGPTPLTLLLHPALPLTASDLWWPLTATKIRLVVTQNTFWKIPAKYEQVVAIRLATPWNEMQKNNSFWDIVLTRSSQLDLWWPLADLLHQTASWNQHGMSMRVLRMRSLGSQDYLSEDIKFQRLPNSKCT